MKDRKMAKGEREREINRYEGKKRRTEKEFKKQKKIVLLLHAFTISIKCGHVGVYFTFNCLSIAIPIILSLSAIQKEREDDVEQ